MVIADTCIWIEYFKGNPKYVDIMDYLMQEKELLAIEFVFAELLQGARNKNERLLIYEFWDNLPKVIDDHVLLKAGSYSAENKLFAKGLSLIDVSIYLLAKRANAQVWTVDKRLCELLAKDERFDSPL